LDSQRDAFSLSPGGRGQGEGEWMKIVDVRRQWLIILIVFLISTLAVESVSG